MVAEVSFFINYSIGGSFSQKVETWGKQYGGGA